MPRKIIGIFANTGKAGAGELASSLWKAFRDRDCEVILDEETAAFLKEGEGLPAPEVGRNAEIVMALGGDGTILQAVHALGSSRTPVFGINLGSLGFLTCLSSDLHLQAVEAVCTDSYVLSQRSMLDVAVERNNTPVCRRAGLNDAVISRGAISRLIKLETRVDDALLTEYNADGLIVATPTGSTAYSLAAGGPILEPDSGVFVVTPISPHVLTNRSVILSDSCTVEIVPRQVEPEVFLTVDGQDLVKVGQGDVIRITRAPDTLPLAMLPGISFFEVLRQKLKWSGSAV